MSELSGEGFELFREKVDLELTKRSGFQDPIMKGISSMIKAIDDIACEDDEGSLELFQAILKLKEARHWLLPDKVLQDARDFTENSDDLKSLLNEDD